ncbi:MAG: phosphoenolpyruvate synthase [Methanobacterium sp.]|uniref:putative PEP-binding protein n=1 Tax=Methanobacterium sp. TaxID=2164 RepID=UPI003D64C9DD|nr:phosphoenolpyruvate synthase [Methanobacterium sp.]
MKLLTGIGTSSYVGVGKIRKIEDNGDILEIKEGEIIVVSKASRDMLLHLQKAGGVITDYGGITSHVAIVLREMKVPCIVGTQNGTDILENGMIVTVDGRTGNIYGGFIEFESEKELFEIYNPATKIKVNLNVPEIAKSAAPYSDGVGSIRIENMVVRTLKHPRKLLEEGKLTETIKEGVREILDAFYPKPVWFRTFDIPTDELVNLKGGEDEPYEINPLLGLRGIYRDLNDVEILKAEFMAIKYLLDEGYDNLGIKIPFVRDISEYILSKKILKDVGLKPHKDIDVGVSVETPSVVFTFDEFIKEGMDFMTLGMSDLAMCALAVDRRGVRVAKHFDLMHPAILKMVELVINKCNQKGIESCICGHAGGDQEIVKKLVEMGIDCVSTNPDQILKIRKTVYNRENEIIMKSLP